MADYVGKTELNQKICELKFYVQQFTIILYCHLITFMLMYTLSKKWPSDKLIMFMIIVNCCT